MLKPVNHIIFLKPVLIVVNHTILLTSVWPDDLLQALDRALCFNRRNAFQKKDFFFFTRLSCKSGQGRIYNSHLTNYTPRFFFQAQICLRWNHKLDASPKTSRKMFFRFTNFSAQSPSVPPNKRVARGCDWGLQ